VQRENPQVPHQVVTGARAHHRHDHAPLRWRRAAAGAGLLAIVLAVGIAVFSRFGGADVDRGTRDPAPSARHITARPTVPLTDPQILELLQRPSDLGALDDPQGCLDALGYPAGTPVLGAQPLKLGERPAILLVLPAPHPSSVVAVAVGTDCPAGGTGVLARTELARR
jgi:hypothetical protein